MFDSERSSDEHNRRRFLAAAESVAVTTLTAGCFDQDNEQAGDENFDEDAQDGEGTSDTPSTEKDAASGQEGGFDPTATRTEDTGGNDGRDHRAVELSPTPTNGGRAERLWSVAARRIPG